MIDAQEEAKWDKLEATGVDIYSEVVHRIRGTVVISKRELAKKWDMTDRNIKRYIEKGMPLNEAYSTVKFQVFNLEDCERWKMENVDQVQAARLKKVLPPVPQEKGSATPAPKMGPVERKVYADADKAETDAELAKVKLALAKGDVVDADDLDKTLSEQAVIHRTDKTNDEKVLPIILENRTSGEIAVILHDHNQERLGMLDHVINKQFKCSESLFEVIEATLQQLNLGEEPKDIIERIQA